MKLTTFDTFSELAQRSTFVPVVKEIVADLLTPVSAFLKIAEHSDYAFLLESVEGGEHDPVRHGGTGRRVDWELARNVAASRRTILSGGLNPDNVKEAAETVHPFGLDVSSGVESNPGIKDAAKLRRFFEALND